MAHGDCPDEYPAGEPTRSADYGYTGQQPPTPWYQRPAALIGLGMLTAAVLALLVYAVVKFTSTDNTGPTTATTTTSTTESVAPAPVTTTVAPAPTTETVTETTTSTTTATPTTTTASPSVTTITETTTKRLWPTLPTFAPPTLYEPGQ